MYRKLCRRLLVAGLLSAVSLLSAQAIAQPLPDAWCFEMEGQPAAYIRQSDGDWYFVRPDRPFNVLAEISRDDSQRVLQNKRTKLFIKLTADRAYWRQPNQDEWTAYYRGAFGPPPQVLIDAIRAATAAAPAPAALPANKKEAAPETPMQPEPHEHAAMPQDADADDYVIRVAYFVPHDRVPAEAWEQKIRVILFFVDSFYRNDLRLKGFKTPGLAWEQSEGQVKIHLINGRHPARHYNNAPVYDSNRQFKLVGEEVTQHLGRMADTLSLVFCETYSEEPSDRMWKGVIALGAHHSARGGRAMFSAHLLKDEFAALTVQQLGVKMHDRTPVPGRRAWEHRMNSPRGEFIEDGVGAVIHELGHALGLPHDFRDHDRYIMANGFRHIRRNLMSQTPRAKLVTFSDINTHLLMSSRFLNPELDRSDAEPAEAKLEVLRVAPATGQVAVRMTASDAGGLRAYALWDNKAEAFLEGGPLKTERLERTAVVKPKLTDGVRKITLIVTDNGGHQTRVSEEITPGR